MQKNRVKKSIRASIKDGVAWSLMSGFADPYAVPFAMAFGASTMSVGVLRSAPSLAASVFQFYTERLVLRLGRCKRAMLAAVFAQAMALFGSAASVFLPLRAALPVFIAMTVLYTVAGSMAGPPWSALMGEYIPASRRGDFFGWRYQILGVIFFAASYLASRVLGALQGAALWGFFTVFAAAGVFRLVSFYYLTQMYEPAHCFHMPRTGRGVNFLASLDFRRGRVPALFFSVLLLLFSTYLVAPFFSVYSLTELRCGYTRYMVLMTIGPLMTYLFMRRWGKAADTYGSVKVLQAAFVLLPLVPFLWALSRNFYYLTAVEIFSGIVWGAYLIGINNFIYETVPSHARAGYNALSGFISGIGQFAGALIGGWLYSRLPAVWGSSFLPLLFISALGRVLAVVPMFMLVGETRKVAAGGPMELLGDIAGFRP